MWWFAIYSKIQINFKLVEASAICNEKFILFAKLKCLDEKILCNLLFEKVEGIFKNDERFILVNNHFWKHEMKIIKLSFHWKTKYNTQIFQR